VVGDRRLGLLPFLGIWGVLTGTQFLLFAGFTGLTGVQIGVGVGLLQLAKYLPTAWRLSDIGRRPTEAVFLVLCPVVNVYGLATFCLQSTPSDTLRERRRDRWTELMDWPEAYRRGATLAFRTAGVGLPLAIGLAVVGSLGGRLALWSVEWCLNADPVTVQTSSEVILGIALLLLAYTFVQYRKRETASRASWFPSLACLPMLLVGAAMFFSQGGTGALIMMTCFSTAWALWWSSVGGAAVAIGWVRSGEGVRSGSPVPASEVVGEIARRTLDVSAAHGGVKHAVTIGMQVLIPGIYYAIQFAFVDHIVVLDPERRALKRSAELTWGHRSRLFQLMLVWFVISIGMYLGLVLVLQPFEDFQAMLFDPRVLDLSTVLLQDLTFALTSWVLTLALLVMYQERVDRETASKKKRAALKEAKAAGEGPGRATAAETAGAVDAGNAVL
jgi:hypothetical protein